MKNCRLDENIVAVNDDIVEVDADAEQHYLFLGEALVTFGHGRLDLDVAFRCLDNAGEFQ